MRDRYGRNTFGQSCLLARRLVERGVRFVTINYKGWDTHKLHFQIMSRKLPEMDKGMATLLQDLADRGLLESTIVWWSGEFGRTPRIQWEAPWNWAGAAITARSSRPWSPAADSRAATCVGASDAKGEEVKDRPVYPCGPDRQHVRVAGHRSRREAAAPAGAGRSRHAEPADGREEWGTAEGDHVGGGPR